MWKWIAAIILLLLVWRKLYPQTTVILPQTMTAGDGFNASCTTTVAGVCEPCTGIITTMPHMIFPVDPPPIQIQEKVPTSVPKAPIGMPVLSCHTRYSPCSCKGVWCSLGNFSGFGVQCSPMCGMGGGGGGGPIAATPRKLM